MKFKSKQEQHMDAWEETILGFIKTIKAED